MWWVCCTEQNRTRCTIYSAQTAHRQRLTTWQLVHSCSIHLMNLWHCTAFYTGNGKCHQPKPRKCPKRPSHYSDELQFQTAKININFYVYCCTFLLNSDSDFCQSSRFITQQEFWNSRLLLWLASVSSYVPYSVAPHPVHYVCVCCNQPHTEHICKLRSQYSVASYLRTGK